MQGSDFEPDHRGFALARVLGHRQQTGVEAVVVEEEVVQRFPDTLQTSGACCQMQGTLWQSMVDWAGAVARKTAQPGMFVWPLYTPSCLHYGVRLRVLCGSDSRETKLCFIEATRRGRLGARATFDVRDASPSLIIKMQQIEDFLLCGPRAFGRCKVLSGRDYVQESTARVPVDMSVDDTTLPRLSNWTHCMNPHSCIQDPTPSSQPVILAHSRID